MKITANEISTSLIEFCHGSYDILLPNFYYGIYECDLFRINQSGFVVEYEIKVSRSDFFADFKKGKHKKLACGEGSFCPNRFFYVVPDGLIKKNEVPEYAGLIVYNQQYGGCSIIKAAKLIHKRTFENYKSIAISLSNRAMFSRAKMKRIRRTYLIEKETQI